MSISICVDAVQHEVLGAAADIIKVFQRNKTCKKSHKTSKNIVIWVTMVSANQDLNALIKEDMTTSAGNWIQICIVARKQEIWAMLT